LPLYINPGFCSVNDSPINPIAERMEKSKDYKPRILIIDDEESIRYSFEIFLTEAGYTVITAGSYKEALARISEINFDLIFIDIILGVRSGIDVLREISKRDIFPPVIMITGDPDAATAQEAFKLGAYGHISKPISQEKLLRLTKSALRA
jgi:two-component system response regulator HydG